MIVFRQGDTYCTGSITEAVKCAASAISAAEKFIVKCISSCSDRNAKIARDFDSWYTFSLALPNSKRSPTANLDTAAKFLDSE